MKRKLIVVALPIVILFMVLGIFACWHKEPWAAILVAVWVTILVISAMFESPLEEEKVLDRLKKEIDASTTSLSSLEIFYERTTQMHIDTDKGMYELITVFVAASLLVLSWIVANSNPTSITKDHIIVVGSLAVVLVGVATLLKHRLRHYNKLREVYLRGLEQKLCGTDSKVGLHSFMKNETGAGRGISVNFHEVIDIYYFIYLFIWIVVYLLKV